MTDVTVKSCHSPTRSGAHPMARSLVFLNNVYIQCSGSQTLPNPMGKSRLSVPDLTSRDPLSIFESDLYLELYDYIVIFLS